MAETPGSTSASLSWLRPEVASLKNVLDDFVERDCIPAEASYARHLESRHGADRWKIDAVPPCLEELKQKAKDLGLWNLFIPPHLVSKIPDPDLAPSIPLSYREYGILCESLGRSPHIAPEACNSSAPDTYAIIRSVEELFVSVSSCCIHSPTHHLSFLISCAAATWKFCSNSVRSSNVATI